MTGLIMKDVLVLLRRYRVWYWLAGAGLVTALVLTHAVRAAPFVAMLAPAVGTTFLVELIKVDHEGGWQRCLPALPVTCSDIVLSRYIFCALSAAAFGAMGAVLCAAASAVGRFPFASLWEDFAIGGFYALIVAAFGVPASFLFKYETGFTSMMAGAFLFAAVHGAHLDSLFLQTLSPVSALAAVIAAAGAMYVSYRVALWAYTVRRHRII